MLNAIKVCTQHASVEASEFVLNAIKLLHTACWCLGWCVCVLNAIKLCTQHTGVEAGEFV